MHAKWCRFQWIEMAVSCGGSSFWTLPFCGNQWRGFFDQCSRSPASALNTMLETKPKGRSTTLSKVLLAAALLGGTALYADSAQAVGWTPNGPIPFTGYKCNLSVVITPGLPNPDNTDCFNVPSPLVGDKRVTLLERSTNVGTNTDVVEFTLNKDDPNTPWHFTLDFNPNRNGELTDVGFLKYKIEIVTPSDLYFDQVKLSNTSTITNPLAYTLKKTFWDPTFTTQIVTTALENPPTPQGINLSSLRAQVLYVKDEWIIQPTANGVVDNIQNTFGQRSGEVPSPLPLLGVGAAFGMGRKLRLRIKAARQG